MTRDYQRPVRIDWARIAAAEEFYAAAGFTPVAVPWVVGDAAYRATLPADASPYATLGGYLVASGEQSFLQLLDQGVDLCAAQCTTPCFRDEDHDSWHAPYFLKVELLRADDTSDAALEAMIDTAASFLSTYIPVTRLRLPDGSTDLVTADGVELGSYGRRRRHGHTWLFGTGVAEPRLAAAIAAGRGSEAASGAAAGTGGLRTEPAPRRTRPSDEYLQTLRDLGAGEETIRLASGESRPRGSWLRPGRR